MSAGATVVTGAAGFLGRALVAALVARGANVVATDLAGEHLTLTGDICDAGLQSDLFARPVAALFHLAGIMSGRAEAEFEHGKRVNLDATIALLEQARAQMQHGGPRVTVVYASSIAVFGLPPQCFDDATEPNPAISYGAHKRAVEILLDDYSRRGFLDGRGVRLSGVVVRPPAPNGALSAFNSDILREPLAGRPYTSPLPADASIWLTSLASAVDNLLHAVDLPSASLGRRRTVTAPALAVSLGDIAATVGRRSGASQITFPATHDPALRDSFGAWPLDARFDRARDLGFTVEGCLDALIRSQIERGALAG